MSHPLVDVVVSVCKAYGVQAACIGAGSRSTPLVESLHAHGIMIHAWVDERAVGFMALGIAKASRRPVMVVTTSGTAVSNVYPAITEAAMSWYPIIICSADRPTRFINTSANQTIQQVKMFNNVIRNLQMPESDAGISDWRDSVCDACREQAIRGGVIHINCPLEDPVSHPYRFRAGSEAIDGYPTSHAWPSVSIQSVIDGAQSGIVCIGQCEPWVDESYLATIVTDLGWPTIVDVTHHGLKQLSGVAQSADAAATAWMTRSFDCVLYLGGPWVSKKMPVFFDQHRSVVHHISQSYQPVVPLPRKTIYGAISNGQSYGHGVRVNNPVLDAMTEHDIQTMRTNDAEFDMIHTLLDGIEYPIDCFISNSLPIRHVDWLKSPCIRQVYANRGASGIDGNIATIVGIGLVPSQVPLLAIVGDLTAIYDLNAWALLNRVQRPLSIVVVNNGGGAIFDRLPISQSYDGYDAHIKLSHAIKLQPILEAMGIVCHSCIGAVSLPLAFDGEVIEWTKQ